MDYLSSKRFLRKLKRYDAIFGNKRKAYRKSRWLKWKARIRNKVGTCCCGFVKKKR